MGCIFDPAVLHEIARKRVGLPHQEMVRAIIHDLAESYPGHIETRENWLFSLTGGAVGIMTILHGSLSEYLIIYGTPIGTRGFSGRYLLDIHDFLLAGELWTFTEEHFREKIVTRPGEAIQLQRGQAKGFLLSDGAWMLEYGRGLVPTSLPMGLGDAVFSCMDWRTIVKTLWLYGKLVVKELWQGKI